MTGWRLGIFIGLAVVIWSWRWTSGINPNLQLDQQVKITGTIFQQPSIKTDQYTGEEYQWVWISVDSESFGFRAGRWDQLQYGDKVVIEGKLKTLGEKNKTGKKILWMQPRRWIIDKPVISTLRELCSRGGEISYAESTALDFSPCRPSVSQGRKDGLLSSVRQRTLTLFRTTLPQNEAALLSGMVLGTKGDLSDNFKSYLQASGTIHVVVASGFNVMLVGGTLVSILLLWMRRQTAVIWGILGVWGYVGLVGFDAPVVRAGIMGSLAFVGIATGRVRDTGWLLVTSAIIMLWWRPQWLWDVGFQLSVAATAGLIWVEPVLFKVSTQEKQEKDRSTQENKFPVFSRINPAVSRVLIESLRTTIAAQIAVLPIILHTFGSVSLLSPITNALVLWVVPLVTGVGMIVGIFHLLLGFSVFSFISSFVLWIIWPLLKYFVIIVQWFAQWGTVNLKIPLWFGGLYYIILWLIVRKAHAKIPNQTKRG